MEIGLADGVGDLRAVLRERYGKNVCMRTIERRPGWLRRRFGFGGDAENSAPILPFEGGSLIDGLLSAVEARAWWSRFGL